MFWGVIRWGNIGNSAFSTFGLVLLRKNSYNSVLPLILVYLCAFFVEPSRTSFSSYRLNIWLIYNERLQNADVPVWTGFPGPGRFLPALLLALSLASHLALERGDPLPISLSLRSPLALLWVGGGVSHLLIPTYVGTLILLLHIRFLRRATGGSAKGITQLAILRSNHNLWCSFMSNTFPTNP